MRIGFDSKIVEDEIYSILNTLVREHELFVFISVQLEDALKAKKQMQKKMKKAGISCHIASIQGDMAGAAKRNHIDIFVTPDVQTAEEISVFSDAVKFSGSAALLKTLSKIIAHNSEPLLPSATIPKGLPSQDQLWLKYYRRGDTKWNGESMSPYDRLVISNQDWTDETAMSFFGRKFTYQEFFTEINRLSNVMTEDGISKGVRVPVVLLNTPESLITLYALYKVKATIVPLFPLSAKEDMQCRLESIHAQNQADGITETKLFISDLVLGRFQDVIPTGKMQTVVLSITNSMSWAKSLVFRKIAMPKLGARPVIYNAQTVSYQEFRSRSVNLQNQHSTYFSNDYAAVQLYTGGTICPKGVMLTEGNIDAASKQFYNDRFAFQRSDRIAAFMPLNHSFGLIIGTHVAATLGVELDIIMKINFKRLDKLFLKDRVNIFGGIPNMFPAIRNNLHFKKANLSHVKYILSGGSPIDKTEKARTTAFFQAHHSTAEVHDGYGLTESSGGIIYDGVPNICTNVKIVEPGTKRELSYEQIGELCLSGAQIMLGYDEPNLTENVLKRHEDGLLWLHTGDRAVIHEDGRVQIIGRMDRMIKVNGEQVILDDIETLLCTLNFVEKSAVVKKTDAKR